MEVKRSAFSKGFTIYPSGLTLFGPVNRCLIGIRSDKNNRNIVFFPDGPGKCNAVITSPQMNVNQRDIRVSLGKDLLCFIAVAGNANHMMVHFLKHSFHVFGNDEFIFDDQGFNMGS